MVVFFLGGGGHTCSILFFFFRWVGGGKYNVITYWYLISWVLNFVILARQYFTGFYFWDFIGQI